MNDRQTLYDINFIVMVMMGHPEEKEVHFTVEQFKGETCISIRVAKRYPLLHQISRRSTIHSIPISFRTLDNHLYPLAGVLEGIHYLCLGTARLNLVIILPPCRLWQTHQNTLNPAPRLKSKDCSTIVDEVEFNIPSSPHLLPLPLLLRKGIVLVRLDDGSVGGHDRVDSILGKFEKLLRLAVVQVVVEDASQPTCFITMGDDEVFVCPGFELGVKLWIMSVAHVLVCSVEVRHIIQVEV
mmetsp:Transcript_23362/g.50582  ORF Transcript_23362/g.50582 Transcript_23362/m.50582 type:complete len:240 (-) Transcript_23362:845-1564(-)